MKRLTEALICAGIALLLAAFIRWQLERIGASKKPTPVAAVAPSKPVCGVCVRLVESFSQTSLAELKAKRELAYDIGMISFRLGWIDRGYGYSFEHAQSNMTALLKDTLLITNETPPHPSDSESSRP